ncbi:hypothetical protein E1301_Tti014232 [Triplophysa tibetana]|uniref:Uncharacterized protein n=1 Tax=Triplophysa tibetana TaxID=1572043 RepID=A0A5A9N2K1_9TELE|nr:hypothetical protein E1301_Tti014232 [Triplophysa tibetana]
MPDTGRESRVGLAGLKELRPVDVLHPPSSALAINCGLCTASIIFAAVRQTVTDERTSTDQHGFTCCTAVMPGAGNASMPQNPAHILIDVCEFDMPSGGYFEIFKGHVREDLPSVFRPSAPPSSEDPLVPPLAYVPIAPPPACRHFDSALAPASLNSTGNHQQYGFFVLFVNRGGQTILRPLDSEHLDHL